MAGLETAALRTASTVVGTLWRSRLGQVPGARLTDRPLRPAAGLSPAAESLAGDLVRVAA